MSQDDGGNLEPGTRGLDKINTGSIQEKRQNSVHESKQMRDSRAVNISNEEYHKPGCQPVKQGQGRATCLLGRAARGLERQAGPLRNTVWAKEAGSGV